MKLKKKSDVSKAGCLSCGKPLLYPDKCHHCGASQKTRVSEVTMVMFSVGLLIIGGILLVLAQQASDPPFKEIGSLTEEDLFNAIRVKGVVVSAPRWYPEKYNESSGKIRFLVNDTTGECYVRLEAPVAVELMGEKNTPCLGDTIDAMGSCYQSGELYLIEVKDTDHFKIEERSYTPTDIGDIANSDRDELDEFSLIQISGKVTYVNTLSFAYMFDVEDEIGNSVTVFIESGILAITGNGLPPANVYIGSFVTVRGGLLWYDSSNDAYDGWEIIPTGVDYIESDSSGGFVYTYITHTLDDILREPDRYENSLVRIENASIYQKFQDYLFEITDDTTVGNISVYVEYGGDVPATFHTGDHINVQGVFTDYQGAWEIKIRAYSDDMMEVIG